MQAGVQEPQQRLPGNAAVPRRRRTENFVMPPSAAKCAVLKPSVKIPVRPWPFFFVGNAHGDLLCRVSHLNTRVPLARVSGLYWWPWGGSDFLRARQSDCAVGPFRYCGNLFKIRRVAIDKCSVANRLPVRLAQLQQRR